MAGTRARHSQGKRRPVVGDPLRKAGWQVRQSVAEAVRDAVENGAADSQDAFVERALVRELAVQGDVRGYDPSLDCFRPIEAAIACQTADPSVRASVATVFASVPSALVHLGWRGPIGPVRPQRSGR